MFCCVRTRGRKERTFDDPAKVAVRPAAAKVPGYGYDEKSGKSNGHGLKDGNMVVMGATGAVVGATVATAVVVAASNDQTDGGESRGCCFGGGAGGGGCGGGGCGGCGGCGG